MSHEFLRKRADTRGGWVQALPYVAVMARVFRGRIFS